MYRLNTRVSTLFPIYTYRTLFNGWLFQYYGSGYICSGGSTHRLGVLHHGSIQRGQEDSSAQEWLNLETFLKRQWLKMTNDEVGDIRDRTLPLNREILLSWQLTVMELHVWTEMWTENRPLINLKWQKHNTSKIHPVDAIDDVRWNMRAKHNNENWWCI